VASSGRDGLIKLWDAHGDASSAGLATLHSHKGPVNQVRHAVQLCQANERSEKCNSSKEEVDGSWPALARVTGVEH
jgi:WD40 repeat protein